MIANQGLLLVGLWL